MQKKILAVIRGSQPRMSEINFYSRFKKLKIRFICDSATGFINKRQIPGNIEFVNAPLVPAFGIDPWAIFGQTQIHRSFRFIGGLEDIIKDCSAVNISDLIYFYDWQSAKIARKLSLPLVTSVWMGLVGHPSAVIPPYSFCVNTVRDNTKLFIARSHLAEKYLLSLGVSPGKIKLIYKGIDVNKFIPCKKKIRQKIRLIFVGQLIQEKGVADLVEIFKDLSREYRNLELILVAKSHRDKLLPAIRKSNLKDIVIYSQVNYNSLSRIYRDADIYCHLSKDWKYLGLIPGGNDYFPYAVLEAMASGLPVIATRCGGIPEELGEKYPGLVSQNSPKNTLKVFKRLIENASLRRSWGSLNRERVTERFNMDIQAEKTESEILKII